jgi:hypothetical protein
MKLLQSLLELSTNKILPTSVIIKKIVEDWDGSSLGYFELKHLPTPVQDHIKNTLRLNPKDVEVKVATNVSPDTAYGDGHRAHFALIHNAGEKPTRMTWSSWGGANPFSPRPLDRPPEKFDIPSGHSVVTGSSQRYVRAVYFHPDDIAKILPSQETPDLSDQHFKALDVYKSIKPGPYRREYLSRHNVTTQHIDDLVNSGYLRKNKAGAISITTSGKNAHKLLSKKYSRI